MGGAYQIAEDQRDFGFVSWVVEDGAGELVHGCDARAAGDERDALVLVGFPGVFWDRALHVQPLAGFHVVEVGAHGPARVFLDQEIQEALLAFGAHGRVGSDRGLAVLGTLVLCEQSTGDWETGDIVRAGEGEAEYFGVVVDVFDFVEFEGDEALVAALEGFGCGDDGGGGGRGFERVAEHVVV